MAARQLLVISGPIASGKRSTAHLLAAHARAQGRTAAVMDLDRVYTMLDDASPMNSDSVWRQARRAAAALANQFVADGIDLVIVEGDFWTVGQRDITEQIGGQPETTQALEFGDFADDAVEADRTSVH